MNLLSTIRQAFAAATPAGGDPGAFAAAVRPSSDAKFGDYQANGCMALAKAARANPRALAEQVARDVQLEPLAPPPEIAGPGFLNVRLHDTWLAATLSGLVADPTLGIAPAAPARTVVIDYSSPNVAKPMHVGHIRSTVIGDALARAFTRLGHRVVRDNHLGDWGSQFGMILWAWKNHRDEDAYADDPVEELSRLYRLTQARIQDEAAPDARAISEACRAETAKLHAGDPENRALWRRFMPHCLAALQTIYDRLGVQFDVQLGESFYDEMLADVVADLERKGIATESEGATVAFVEGQSAPFIIRKRDGAYNYATTDLATIKYRVDTWNPDLILYVVDHRQSDHFKLLFDVARRWGSGHATLEHVAFGTILGMDRRPFRTRSGDTVGLESLLDEAVGRARIVVDANSPELPVEERARVAEIVGLGAIKYADLAQNRTSDYVFDWDKMLALSGNTATYMQYAYARIRSIFRKGEVDADSLRASNPQIELGSPHERALGLLLLRLPETLEQTAAELKPNILTDYLFALANAFSAFFENCPVLKAPTDSLRDSRLALCDLTARTLAFGLESLGIRVVERM